MQYYVIAHHGILNMKWGQRNGPPYPLSPGQHSAAEKKAMRKQARAERREERKIKRLRKKADRLDKKQVKKEAKQAKEYAKEQKTIDEVVRSGTAKEVLKYQGKLTNQQLQDAMNRIDWEDKLKARAAKEDYMNSDAYKRDQALEKVSDLKTKAEKVIGLYNTVAKVNNAFNKSTELPTIGGGESAFEKVRKKKEAEADKKERKEQEARDKREREAKEERQRQEQRNENYEKEMRDRAQRNYEFQVNRQDRLRKEAQEREDRLNRERADREAKNTYDSSNQNSKWEDADYREYTDRYSDSGSSYMENYSQLRIDRDTNKDYFDEYLNRNRNRKYR